MVDVKKPDADEVEQNMPKVPGAKRTSVPNEDARDPAIGGSSASGMTETKEPDPEESREQRPFVPETSEKKERNK
jgi:hypothetical protein